MENNSSPQDIQLVPANLFKRLANYIIDFFVFWFVFSLIPYGKIIEDRLMVMQPAPTEMTDQQMAILLQQLSAQLLFGCFFCLFVSLCEALLKGKSLGKLLTGTRAVYHDGKPIEPQTAFLRGIIRLVPFEQFSALGLVPRPWHDRWSSTVVMDESKSSLPKE